MIKRNQREKSHILPFYRLFLAQRKERKKKKKPRLHIRKGSLFPRGKKTLPPLTWRERKKKKQRAPFTKTLAPRQTRRKAWKFLAKGKCETHELGGPARFTTRGYSIFIPLRVPRALPPPPPSLPRHEYTDFPPSSSWRAQTDHARAFRALNPRARSRTKRKGRDGRGRDGIYRSPLIAKC